MAITKYIHYGSDSFDPYRWVDIINGDGGFLNKPYGGLWASAVDAKFGWYDWCKRENFSKHDLAKSFTFTLSENARILYLTPDNVWDLPITQEYIRRFGRPLPKEIYGSVRGIDFEALSREYDVLDFCISKYPSMYWSLYGWDCDSVLILNKDVIRVE